MLFSKHSPQEGVLPCLGPQRSCWLAPGSRRSSPLTNRNTSSTRAKATKGPPLTSRLQLKLKTRALQLFCELPSVSWINTEEEAMRREASFIRKGGCPSGSQTSPKSVYICTHLSSSIFQHKVTGSPATCLGYLDAVSIPGNCPQKKKISRGNKWVIIQYTPSSPLILVYNLFQRAPSLSP